ncbi:MAG TPA: methyltransferase domain-containing protein [bacterium]|nr:methyltransferase domain-containing protein [bacterium]
MPPPDGVIGGLRPSAAVHELMDDPACTAEMLRPNLEELARINRLTGSVRLVCRYLDRLLPLWRGRRSPGAPLLVLDVATGGADIPRAVARWARRRDVPIRIVAVEGHPVTAALAAEASAAFPQITVVRADARALPFPDRSFDACLCSISLHHLDPGERPALVRRLDGLARLGFLVVDLVRSPAAYAGVWLLTRGFRSPLIRTDGPRSVRRAYSWAEYRAVAAAAGVPTLALRRVPMFRAALERVG